MDKWGVRVIEVKKLGIWMSVQGEVKEVEGERGQRKWDRTGTGDGFYKGEGRKFSRPLGSVNQGEEVNDNEVVNNMKAEAKGAESRQTQRIIRGVSSARQSSNDRGRQGRSIMRVSKEQKRYGRDWSPSLR